MKKAIIVGGGIGGLATAVALTRRGWHLEVLERSSRFAEVGAGLSVWPNALRALDALGLGETARAHALSQGQAGIRDSAGRWLSRTDTADLERRYGQTVMMRRADLLDVLKEALPSSTLRGGTTVSHVGADGVVVHSAGTSRADLVVGADGIRSTAR
ncbi:MAG TPA: FAD-dependent monooxygenase [Actinomadura sp.]|jgi:2-polyprenyl-6-methoxyphenol hydroxylase-like FAD-dependent oxidoreductase|nr:FAD-dependent monooxygenase [Actinomadura sp.]